ncbi:MAG: polysaccharide deacetylase family protein [Bacillota bacterium]|nr:polysaccharide deacetylase family protein [Bacillota bacterium]
MKNKVLYLFLTVLITISMISGFSYSVKGDNDFYNPSEDEMEDKVSKSDKKIIYLTFDDGPSSSVNNEVLDILKAKDVKATFFLVGYKIPGREDVIKRIHNEGHGIGLHTYSHKTKLIYSSEDNFVKEMDQTRDEIKKVINYSPTAIRFPYGSKKRLTSSLLEKLHSHNYKIYDWNVCVSDGIDYNAPASKLYREATKYNKNFSRIFLLMHCDAVNKNTCKALPQVIDFYKKLGYEFQPITENTSEYYFRVKK